MALPQMRFLLFKTESCSVCVALAKARTLEKFIDKLEKPIPVTPVVCAADDDDMKDALKAKNYDLGTDYNVEMYPTIILEAKLPDGTALELSRAEGGVTLKQMNETFGGAIEAFRDQFESDDGTRTQNEASKEVAW